MNSLALLCDQYCIFCVGGSEFAISAPAVREIADLVPIVEVPRSDGALKGLCHHRNEFLPVLSLPALLGKPSTDNLDLQFLLVLESADGPWALPISRAVALEPLEMASIGELGREDARPIVMGTASFRDGVVRILDADRLYQSAVDVLSDVWINREQRTMPHDNAAVNLASEQRESWNL